MKTKLLHTGLSVIVGFAVAFAVYLWLYKPDSTRQELADMVKRSEYVYRQYKEADYNTARHAMLDHIRLLDKLISESADPLRNPYSADAMTWYVRLAKLEERNNKPGKPECMQEATARCKKLGRADCSEDSLRHQVDRMDKIALAKESDE